jgi:hypothetical protein
MNEVANITGIAHIIQIAVAPVFLLMVIGTLLIVMTNRLGRIIDRARVLEGQLKDAPAENLEILHGNLANLSRRAKLIGYSITLSTATALSVCVLIAMLFLGDFLEFNITITVAALFIIAMMLLITALLCLLREILISTANLRIGPR